MNKTVLTLSGAIVFVALTAAFLWKQLDAERGQLAGLRATVAELERSQQAPALPAAPMDPAIAAPPVPGVPAAAGAPAAGNDSSANPAARPQQIVRGLADVLSSPEGSDLIRNQVRAALAQQFPDLATELRLTPVEEEQFMDLLARQASGMTGDALGMISGGSGEAAQENQRRMIEKQLAGEKEIARVLGSKYPAWQEYQGTAAARQQISQLRSLLGSGPDALGEAQAKPLIAALGVEQARINKEEQNRMSTALRSAQKINVLEDQLKSMSAHNERLVGTASSHLTSNQLDRYKRMLAQQENMVRAIIGSANGAPR